MGAQPEFSLTWRSQFPAEVRESEFLRHGGFSVVRCLLDSSLVADLQREARGQRLGARLSESAGSDQICDREADPARRYHSAPGGSLQHAVFCSSAFLTLVEEIVGFRVEPAGGGTYTYYGPGDFLGLHRDIRICDLAVIACLRNQCSSPGSGSLMLYPHENDAPLRYIRDDPRASALPVRLEVGECALLLGGIVAHELPPLGPADERVVSLNCYRAPGGRRRGKTRR